MNNRTIQPYTCSSWHPNGGILVLEYFIVACIENKLFVKDEVYAIFDLLSLSPITNTESPCTSSLPVSPNQ